MRPPANILIVACAAVVSLTGWAVVAGHTESFDERAVRMLRRPDDLAVPVGPAWLREAALDVTALGSVVVVLAMAAAVAGFLLTRRRLGAAVLVCVAASGGMILNTAIKHLVDRPRPEVVPHLREVTTPSFPSGHAAFSAVVYLTLGVLAARAVPGRGSKMYCLAVAAAATVSVGVSRVYLGVHYPTDVLAGWVTGSAWALACSLAAPPSTFVCAAEADVPR